MAPFSCSVSAWQSDALGHELLAEAESARGRLDQQRPQLRGVFVFLDNKDAAGKLVVALGDPARLALRFEIIDEPAQDRCDQRLEALVPAVLLGI
jgi:hypothetical protein